MLNHLVHRALLLELAILIAVDAVIFIFASIGIGAEDFLGERHSAALAEFLFHMFPLHIFTFAKLVYLTF